MICGVLTAFPAMSIDLGLPGFADVASALGVSIERVSQSLSFFFCGFSLSPLVCGPMSDRIGRRPVLLLACLIYAIASLFAATTSTFDSLLLWRLLQGAGAGVAAVLALTVIRDYHQGAEARRLLSYAAVIRIIGPTTAPTLGNLLLFIGTWRWIYGLMAVGGVMMFLMVGLGLRESSPTLRSATAQKDCSRALPEGPPRRSVLDDYKAFLGDRLSLSYALIAALTFASHFTYITGSLYVYVNVVHISTLTYGGVFAVMALCLMLGSLLNGRLAKHALSADFIIGIGLVTSVLSSLTTLALTFAGYLNVYNLTALLSINTLCLGMLTPCAQQGAMEKAAGFAGTASALMNALTTGMGAFASYVEGLLLVHFDHEPAVVMSAQMAVFGVSALLIFVAATFQRPSALAQLLAGEP